MSMQKELKQTRPFVSSAQEASLALLRTADLVRRSASGVLEPLGVTLQQYNVLRILRGAGDEGLPTLEIAGRMIEQTPGITRLLDRLEAKKLVARTRCPRDRRQVLCRITGGGLALLASADGPLHAAEIAALAPLSPRETKQLLALLERARTGLHAALLARRADHPMEAR